jgi:ABC-type transport system involved in multi-copper enzyme maturation permease subunit
VSGRYQAELVPTQRLILWALLLIPLAVLLRRSWLRLFGPVLFYDLVRLSRRGRNISLRCLYAGALAIVLFWLYQDTMTVSNRLPGPPPTGARLLALTPLSSPPTRAKLLADFAEQFFTLYMIIQFGFVLVLTPVYAASSIAEEKDRKTLEFLLATDLANREIILSKVVSRLATLALVVMTGLPILSILQFLGGVDPELLLAGFAATGLTMLSLVCLSVLASVYARKPRDAILLTYFTLALYIGLGYLAQQLLAYPALADTALGWGDKPLTVGSLINGFNAGNVPIVLNELRTSWSAGKALGPLIGGVLRGYLIFHGLVAAVCTGWAVLRVRTVALRQSTEKRKSSAINRRPRIRPRLAIKPMVWKEVFVEPGFRLTWMGWIVAGVFVIISLLPALWIFAQETGSALAYTQPWGRPWSRNMLPGRINEWIRMTGTILGCLMLLGVAARASTSISGERDRDTMDALLASPLQSHDILFGKWLGSLLSVRWAWLWLWLLWVVAICAGGLHPLSTILFGVAWLVYASVFAGIGLWFSTSCRTSMRATLCTLATTAMVGAGHLGIWFCCLPVGIFQMGGEFMGIQAALTPPAVLYWVSASLDELGDNSTGDVKIILCYFTLFLWALAGLFLWTITRSRFRRITSRMPYHRPDLRLDPSETLDGDD